MNPYQTNMRGNVYRDDSDGIVPAFNYENITTTGTFTVKTSPGFLKSITLNSPVATSVITIYDNSTASGTKIGTITVPSSPQPVTLFYDEATHTGLTIVVATAASDITVNYI